MFIKLKISEFDTILVNTDTVTEIYSLTELKTRIFFNCLDRMRSTDVQESLEEIEKLIEKGNRLGCGVVSGDK